MFPGTSPLAPPTVEFLSTRGGGTPFPLKETRLVRPSGIWEYIMVCQFWCVSHTMQHLSPIVLGITVTLTNSGTTSSLSSELVACIKVELFLPALQELPIHTKQFTLTITVEDGGSVNVITVIDEANLGLAMAPDEFVEEDFSGSRPAPPIDVAILTPSPIQYGQTVTLSASNDLGYYLRVVGLTPPMVNEIFPDTLTLGKSDATFEIPFEKFLSGTSLELTVSVEWSMTIGEGGRRQLLASTSSLRNGRFASDLSSSTERHHHELIQLKLELDPSSVMVAGGYSVKVVSILGIVTTTMVAAAAAALV